MIGLFADWAKKTADIKQLVVTKDANGVPVESETTVKAGLKVNYWTNSSQETNQNDKFVDQAVGTVLIPASITVDTTMWFEIDGEKHYVIGVDDVAGFGDFKIVSWRREHV